jgi:hypothetical protein
MYVEAEHVQKWVTEHGARVLAVAQSRMFTLQLEGLPWNSAGNGLNWPALPSRTVDLDQPTAREELGTSRLARHDWVFALYTPDEPGVLAPFAAAVDSLDELYWKASGPRYLCGADLVDDDWPPRIWPSTTVSSGSPSDSDRRTCPHHPI